jgi:hypothetical protein
MSPQGKNPEDRRIVAVGFLTQGEVALIGAQLSRLYPVEDVGPFAELLAAIDRADSAPRRGTAERTAGASK